MRVCNICGLHATTDEDLLLFVESKKSLHGRQKMCKKCAAAKSRDIYHPADKHNTSKEEYDRCMSTSDCCEVCGSKDKLCYDHSHVTMEFRGVLCSNCNAGIGLLGDNIQGVQQALKYLKEKGE